MIFGLSLYTFVHVLISLAAILSGVIVLIGLWMSERMSGWTIVFLVFTAATNLTGFGFPIKGLTPGLILGALSSVVLLLALLARYRFHMRGAWRPVYVISAVSVLYFNVFVLIAQSFLKVPALHALAPTGSEPPFGIAQGAGLLLFVAGGILAVMRFRPAA
jgi:hypothetical protein